MSTKEQILHEATIAFAEQGYSGLRMDALAETCGINKATIYYHFKSKEALFESVVEHNMREIIAIIQHAIADAKTPETKLKAYISAMMQRKRDMVAIMTREIINGGDHLPTELFTLMLQIFKPLEAILKEGNEAGVFEMMHPWVIIQIIIGSTNHHILSNRIRERAAAALSDHELPQPETPATFAEQLSELILNAIRKPL